MPRTLSKPKVEFLPPPARFAAVALVLWEGTQREGGSFAAEIRTMRTDLASLGYAAHPYPSHRKRLSEVGWDIPPEGLQGYLDQLRRPLVTEWRQQTAAVTWGQPRPAVSFDVEEARAIEDAVLRKALGGPYGPYVAFHHLADSERPRLAALATRWFPPSAVQEPSAFGALSASHVFLALLTVFDCTWQTVPCAIRAAATEGMLVPLYWPTALPAARMWDGIDQRLRQAFQEPGQTVHGLGRLYDELSRECRQRWSEEDPNDGYNRYLRIGGDLPERDAVNFVRQHYKALRRLNKAIPSGQRASAWWRSLEGVLREWRPYAAHQWGHERIPSGDDAFDSLKVVKDLLETVRRSVVSDERVDR